MLKPSIGNGSLNEERIKELEEIDKINVLDLSDKFVDVLFESIGNFKEEMIKLYKICSLFQSKMSKEFKTVKDKLDDRNSSIFKYKQFSQEKYLKELDNAMMNVDKVLTENFNLLNFMGNLKVEEAIIIEGKEMNENV